MRHISKKKIIICSLAALMVSASLAFFVHAGYSVSINTFVNATLYTSRVPDDAEISDMNIRTHYLSIAPDTLDNNTKLRDVLACADDRFNINEKFHLDTVSRYFVEPACHVMLNEVEADDLISLWKSNFLSEESGNTGDGKNDTFHIIKIQNNDKFYIINIVTTYTS